MRVNYKHFKHSIWLWRIDWYWHYTYYKKFNTITWLQPKYFSYLEYCHQIISQKSGPDHSGIYLHSFNCMNYYYYIKLAILDQHFAIYSKDYQTLCIPPLQVFLSVLVKFIGFDSYIITFFSWSIIDHAIFIVKNILLLLPFTKLIVIETFHSFN